MNFLKKAALMLGMILVISLSVLQMPIIAAQPSGYDLVAVVNAHRAANGYYQLNTNSLVMAAAQTHAEWIVETGQGGHIGAGGSNETERVSWTGYGGGAAIQCDENWASGSTLDWVMNSAWADWTHQEVMLNQWGNLYTDIGGGVAALGNDHYVYVLNVCKVIGQESSGGLPDETIDPLATEDLSNYIYGVTLATPQADGTIMHTVRYGQTLATIAEAYGITIDALRELNNMAPDYTDIWPDDELLIQEGTGDPMQPTSTQETNTSATAHAATQTPRPLSSGTMIPLKTATPAAISDEMQPTQIAGMLLLGMAGVGLVIVLFFSYKKK